jgi:hypothetical protein
MMDDEPFHPTVALAQHHGMSTRLLDWTRNPLVALYLAVCKEHETRDNDGRPKPEDAEIVAATNLDGQSNCRTLEELLEGLDPETFWRAHRSFVVNINRIKEVVPWFKSSYQLRMDDKKQTEIPVSRAQTKRLRELFGL